MSSTFTAQQTEDFNLRGRLKLWT